MHTSHRFRSLGLPAALTVASALFLLIIDWEVGSLLGVTNALRLQGVAVRELPHLLDTLAILQDSVTHLSNRLEPAGRREPPTVGDIKTLATENSLRIDRVERLQKREEADQFPEYRITFHGSIGGAVHLLRDLEESYTCSTERVELWPYRPDGSMIAMSLTMATRE